MAGGLVLSNRVRAMQESARSFGDSVAGMRDQQRKISLEDEDRKIQEEERRKQDELRALQMAAATQNNELGAMQIRAGQRAETDILDKQGARKTLDSIGQAVPANEIGLPGFSVQRSEQKPEVAAKAEADLKDRLMARMQGVSIDEFKAAKQAAAEKKTQDDLQFKADLDYKAAQTVSQKTSAAKEAMETKKLEKEIEAIGKGGIDPEKVAAIEGKLRGEFINQNKVFMDVRDAYSRISSADPTAAGDLSLIFNYMKMLDPGSTVREGEFANAENAGGAGDKVMNVYNKVVNGERLQPGQRADFLKQAKNLYQTQSNQYGKTTATYTTLATKYGVDPTRVVLDMAAPERKQEVAAGAGVPKITGESDYASLPSGSEYLDPQGNLRRKK